MALVEFNNRRFWLTLRSAGAALLALSATSLVAPQAGTAQTLNERLAAKQKPGDKSRMIVDAREVVYDRDKDRVSAVGDVQVYYQGRVLEADRVTYDRKTKRVYAEGNAKLTEANGTKSYGERFDLTDDFKDGFIDSLRVESPDKQRISAARAERTGGETTVYERGTYSPCEPCKEAPEKPPLWQVKAARIIHNNSEQRMYYENATLEFWGVPVMWLPFFAAPDPSVTRQSGILAPHFITKKKLGYGASLPFFWAAAPNYDVTLTPTYFSRQGFLGDVFWRHRLEHGSYNIRATGIFQRESTAFSAAPNGPGPRTFRGSLTTKGKFFLNEKWSVGWDATLLSDKYFLTDYKLKTVAITQNYFPEIISTAYLTGRGERSWFDLRAYRFQGTTSVDWQPQSPDIAPVFDFNRKFTPNTIGGELDVTLNLTALNRQAADFQSIPAPGTSVFLPRYGVLDSRGYYLSCLHTGAGGVTGGGYNPTNCNLRGMAGQYTRASANVTWRRALIDPIGQVWTPFIGLQADMLAYRMNTTDYINGAPGGDPYGNNQQTNFLSNQRDFVMRAMPTIGLEYRYPFFAASGWGMHQIEPIAQFVVRPNEQRIGRLPNEDAQSFIFDETTIFAWNKYSGFDRSEGGTRLNYGMQYSFNANNGAYAHLLFGQSLHLAGRNSFAAIDLVHTARNSGLETRRSDYITAATFQPISNLAFSARARFDEETFALRRLDAEARANIGPVTVSTIYSRIAPQPEAGYNLRREGLTLSGFTRLPKDFYVSGAVMVDLDRYLNDRQSVAAGVGTSYKDSPFRLAAASMTLGYRDECTDLSLVYSRAYTDFAANTSRSSTTVMMRMELKHLGEASYSRKTIN